MYLYRLWQPSDLPWLISAVAASAWESLSPEERLVAPFHEVAQRAQQRMYGSLQGPTATALVVQWGDTPVGFVLLTVIPEGATEEPQGYCLEMWVAPEHRRQGLGRGLQNLSEALFFRMGIRKVKLWSGVQNHPYLALAQRMGYAPEGIIEMKML